MGPLRVIAGLQLMVIILLCVPQRRRPIVLGGIIVFGVVGLVLRRMASAGLGVFYESVRPVIVRFGEFHLILLAGVLIFAALLVLAYRMDTKQKRAIRAGSTEAFDQYVINLVGKKHCSLEEATAAATRIRDGKKGEISLKI
jgi:hypothetical protein